jgi:hypothetical protein
VVSCIHRAGCPNVGKCEENFLCLGLRREQAALTSKQKSLDSAVGDRLAELADGSNFGTLEELQEQLLAWSMDLRSGAQSILDYSPPADETTARPDMYTPWPLHDVLAKLIEATEHLLDHHDCDTHGHEEFRTAANRGKELLGSQVKARAEPVTASPIAQAILDRVTEVNVGIFLTGAIDHIERGGNLASGEVELRNGTLVELRMSRLPVKTSSPHDDLQVEQS